MRYSIIIPTYNHLEDCLKPCIESIIKYTDLSDIEIIVVANGCTDDTRTYVEGLGDPFKLIWRDEALGYTKATNLGIHAANGEYIVLLNNDNVLLHTDRKNVWLEILHEPFSRNTNIGISGPVKDKHIKTGIEFLLFFCVMISKEVFRKVGLLDEVYNPGYGEDIDYCARVMQAGYKVIQVPDNTYFAGTPENVKHTINYPIWHQGSKTVHQVPGWEDIVNRNEKILANRYGHLKTRDIKYSIVIPTYNHLHDCLQPCLESIIKYTNLSNIEIIVVANGCRDATVDYVKSLGIEFVLIESEEQLGYTKATNLGMQAAKGKYIVLLNNDVVLLPQVTNKWLDILEEPFNKSHKTGMTGPMLFKGVPGKSNDFIMFFCAMTTRKIVDEIGYLDEIYSPGGVEDVDYGLRLTIAGYDLVAVPEQESLQRDPHLSLGSYPIYHPGGTTCAKEEGWNEILVRNNRILMQKYPDYFKGLDWINDLESQQKSRAKIYDCIPFFNEFVLLKVRLEELWDIVDKFIIVEATHTHSGNAKPLYLKENIEYFEKYADKIILHSVVFDDSFTDPWHREREQRDAAMKVIKDLATDNDFIIVGDCDEIPRASAVKEYISGSCDKVGILNQNRYMYYLNNINTYTDEPQSNSRIVSYKYMRENNLSPSAVRYCDKYNLAKYYDIPNGGWHFTFMGGPDKVIEKIKSFAHTEYDHECKTNRDIVVRNMQNGVDVYNCKSIWRIIQIDSTFPEHVISNKKYYEDIGYIKKTGKIYDCFIFNNELDILEIRLNELYDVVDYFVIVEACFTHQGDRKNLNYENNKSRFIKFAEKIIYIVVPEFPKEDDAIRRPWLNEVYQRNKIIEGLVNCSDNDTIIISDVDEIPNKDKVAHVTQVYSFSQKMFYYSFSCYSERKWRKAKILTYKILCEQFDMNPQKLRNYECDCIENGGWHCSYFGGLDNVMQKLREFSHAEYRNFSREKMHEAMSANCLYYNGEKFIINYDYDNLPLCVKSNMQEYKRMFTTENIYDKLKAKDEASYTEVFNVDVYGMKEADYNNATVIDIGANIGCYAIRAVDMGAQVVHCYEPQSANYKILCDFTSHDKRICRYNFAVTDASVRFVKMSETGASANMYGIGQTDDITVPALSFDDIMNMISSDKIIVKLDCEGAEFDIILNSQIRSLQKATIICVEIHDNLNPNFINKSQMILDRLQKIGYKITYKAPQVGFWYPDGTFVPSPIYCYKFERNS